MKIIPGEKIEINNLDNLIQHHKAFLIRTISNFTGKYVSIENDEAYSIGLAAFAEAVERYEETRGSFLSFSRLVIESRLRNSSLPGRITEIWTYFRKTGGCFSQTSRHKKNRRPDCGKSQP